MGANNSTSAEKQNGKNRRKSKDPSHHEIRAVQNGAKSDTEVSTNHGLSSDHQGADYDNMLYDNNKPLGFEATTSRISIHTDNKAPSTGGVTDERLPGHRTSPVLTENRHQREGLTISQDNSPRLSPGLSPRLPRR